MCLTAIEMTLRRNATTAPKTGAQLIADERQRQLAAGYDAEHDQSSFGNSGLLGDAAANYAYEASSTSRIRGGGPASSPPLTYFPHAVGWKPRANRQEQLAMAGAFCAAEIDRLNLLEQKEAERKRLADEARNKPRRFKYADGTGVWLPKEHRFRFIKPDGTCDGYSGGTFDWFYGRYRNYTPSDGPALFGSSFEWIDAAPLN